MKVDTNKHQTWELALYFELPSSKPTWRSLESSLFASVFAEGNASSFMVHILASYVSLLECAILTIAVGYISQTPLKNTVCLSNRQIGHHSPLSRGKLGQHV